MKLRIKSAVGLFAILLLLVAGIPAVHAENQTLSHTDKKFVEEAARGGLMEVDLANVAMMKSQNTNVKEFANHIVQDHSMANRQLMDLAKNQGFTLPQNMGDDNQNKVNDLSKKEGSDFDRAYMDFMVKDHKSDIKDFSSEAKDGKDPALRSYAAAIVPKLESHLNMAERIQNNLESQNRHG